ncbi:hypothetical protein LOSG293_580060 [Secundilactobacillus oryzae JCM 18671]|uniref:Uncharacterized protein n=1 Tax=Secundilactobacillus oryzae JCM 18671 TaxID=1291743 RepID=A0A081BL33_9LACO|nr:hypothetical protein LOSG293_580060 [Secundilactobacillus oryzae JCM 18671]
MLPVYEEDDELEVVDFVDEAVLFEVVLLDDAVACEVELVAGVVAVVEVVVPTLFELLTPLIVNF